MQWSQSPVPCPLAPSCLAGKTSRVNDLDRVSPTVMAVFGIFRRGTIGVVFGV